MYKTQIFFTVFTVASIMMSSPAWSRNDPIKRSIKEAMNSELGKTKLLSNISVYFGETNPKGAVEKTLGEYTANRKTNAFGKSDTEACQTAFLSAVIALQERAMKEGGNAVINVKSQTHGELISTTEFVCAAGSIMAGVKLKGTAVKIKK